MYLLLAESFRTATVVLKVALANDVRHKVGNVVIITAWRVRLQLGVDSLIRHAQSEYDFASLLVEGEEGYLVAETQLENG